MKVLVTGSAGKLGKAVMQKLAATNIEAVGADIVPGPTTNLLLDVTHKDHVLTACAGVNAIIHTAAIHGRHYDLNYPREAFIDTNIYGTLNLLNASVKCGVKQFYI